MQREAADDLPACRRALAAQRGGVIVMSTRFEEGSVIVMTTAGFFKKDLLSLGDQFNFSV